MATNIEIRIPLDHLWRVPHSTTTMVVAGTGGTSTVEYQVGALVLKGAMVIGSGLVTKDIRRYFFFKPMSVNEITVILDLCVGYDMDFEVKNLKE